MNKVVRVAGGERPEAWAAALGEAGWAERAAVLKEDGGSWVRRATLLGRDVVVKCRVLNTLGRRVKAAIGMGHGAKHWRGAERLMKAGIATGKPLMLGRVSVDGVECEVLVLEFVEGKTLLEVLDEIARGVGPGVREQHAIARAVGASFANITAKKLWNADHKPSNLIVLRRQGGSIDIAIIDCVAVDTLGYVDYGDVEEMAAALIIEPTGCGCLPRRSLWLRVLKTGWKEWPCRTVRNRRDVKYWIRGVEAVVASHGDPRPRVDPLARNRQVR